MDSEVLQNLVEVNLESSNGHVQIIQHSIIIVDLELLGLLECFMKLFSGSFNSSMKFLMRILILVSIKQLDQTELAEAINQMMWIQESFITMLK